MCGCSKKKRLLCWPGLLFSTTKNIWNGDGVRNLNTLSQVQKKKPKYCLSLKIVFTLENFNSNDRIELLLNSQLKNQIFEHNEKVKENREIIKWLIGLTCILGNQGLAFRGHNERADSTNRGNYLEFSDFLQCYDVTLREHLNTAKSRKRISLDIQNNLIKCVGEVIRNTISKEIKATSLVAVILDETLDIQSISQLSTVLRYTNRNKNEIVERFIRFTDVSTDRTAGGLFFYVESLVEKYKFEKKFVGQTYDGAAGMSGHVSGLKQKVLEKYPTAMYVHCYAHVLNLILSQSLTCIGKCIVFFFLR